MYLFNIEMHTEKTQEGVKQSITKFKYGKFYSVQNFRYGFLLLHDIQLFQKELA